MTSHEIARSRSIDRTRQVAGHRNKAVELARGSSGAATDPRDHADEPEYGDEGQSDPSDRIDDQDEHGQP